MQKTLNPEVLDLFLIYEINIENTVTVRARQIKDHIRSIPVAKRSPTFSILLNSATNSLLLERVQNMMSYACDSV